MGNYDDIINLKHHISKKHSRLSIEQRAAQFAPFAALNGYEDAINETARLTDSKIELPNDEKIKINNILLQIDKNADYNPKIAITYFIPDEKKQGGEYVTIIGKLEKINEQRKTILLDNNTEIQIDNIIEVIIV